MVNWKGPQTERNLLICLSLGIQIPSKKVVGTRPISARVFSCVFELFYVVNYMFSCFDGGVGLGGGGGY